MALIPNDLAARRAFVERLLTEDNEYIIDCICEPSSRMLAHRLQYIQAVSRAEAAEERSKESGQMQEAIRLQAEARARELCEQMEMQFEAMYNAEMAQAAATN